MQDLIAPIERYLQETLSATVTLVPWKDAGHVPFFLQERYSFFEARFLGLPCLFMADKSESEEPPAAIRKHIELVRIKWHEPIIYVRERVTAYNRKRLIEQEIPFVVPGNQMYLPMLGIDLREHFRKLRPSKPKFNPATQVVLIHALLRSTENLSPTELAPQLGYSTMTISRAFDELAAAEIGQSPLYGRERHLHFREPKPDIWQRAQPFLHNPVKSRHAIRMTRHRELPGPRAGLSALAQYSMLAEPQNVVVALSREEWKSLQQQKVVTKVPVDEPQGLSIEVWSYAPGQFAGDGLVDRLSLYLSLRETNDERVEAALDQMMRDVAW
jgi:hypothetical protein